MSSPFPYHIYGSGGGIVDISALLAAVKKYLGYQDVATHDSLLQDFIDEALAEFEGDCRQPVALAEAYPYEFEGPVIGEYTPGLKGISLCTKLEIWSSDGGADEDDEWEEIDADLYSSGGSPFTVYYPFVRARYRVTLTLGYDPLPADAVAVLRERTLEKFYDSPQGKSRFGLESEADATQGMVTRSKKYSSKRQESNWDKAVAKYGRRF